MLIIKLRHFICEILIEKSLDHRDMSYKSSVSLANLEIEIDLPSYDKDS